MLCKNIKKKRHIQEKSPFWRERRLAGLSQEKAAERLGISTRTLQKYERGKAQPRFDMVVRMAEIYGCDLYAFLCSRRAGGMTGYRCASAASDQTVLVCMAFWSGSWRGNGRWR